jgi:ATP-dependent Lon protease
MMSIGMDQESMRQLVLPIPATLAEPLQIMMENGARRALIPLENKRAFLEVSGDVVEKVDPVFFSDPLTACHKALNSM